jgi:hypothetical protein
MAPGAHWRQAAAHFEQVAAACVAAFVRRRGAAVPLASGRGAGARALAWSDHRRCQRERHGGSLSVDDQRAQRWLPRGGAATINAVAYHTSRLQGSVPGGRALRDVPLRRRQLHLCAP